MPRFRGNVGYVATVKTAPGVFEEIEREIPYFGSVDRIISRPQGTETLNDNLTLNNTISIIADAFASEHFSDIRYVVWNGTRWKVTSVEVRRPRIILMIGTVYNG